MILVDTSGLVAAMFADQRFHEECAKVLLEAEPPLVLSPFVLAEADYLVLKYGGFRAEVAFLQEVGRGAYELPYFDPRDVKAARDVIENFGDLKIGLADASLVVLAERYSCRDILTLDERHFRALPLPGRKRFKIHPSR
ncbi:MAG TPA: PIN domain-containing protein [Thermoanaerobaculia bacterium]|nr:PIN domain-containing protein [Thermoanaerobaculia bacterium]